MTSASGDPGALVLVTGRNRPAPVREAIIALVTHYDRPNQLTPALTALGRTHIRYGAQLSHYAAVGGTLMSVLRRYAGGAWNAEYEGAWQRAYTWAAGTMMMAAVEAAEVDEVDRMAA